MNKDKMEEFIAIQKERNNLKIALAVSQIINPIKRKSGNFLYFIQCEDLVKIGKANYPEERLKILQTGNPYKLTMLAKFKDKGELEKHLHKQFFHLHIIDEWFKLDTEIINYIKSLGGNCE